MDNLNNRININNTNKYRNDLRDEDDAAILAAVMEVEQQIAEKQEAQLKYDNNEARLENILLKYEDNANKLLAENNTMSDEDDHTCYGCVPGHCQLEGYYGKCSEADSDYDYC